MRDKRPSDASNEFALRWRAYPESVYLTRSLVSQACEACEAWGLGRLDYVGRTIMSELATNAVVHAVEGHEIQAWVTLVDGAVEFRVWDPSHAPPVVPEADAEAEGGRGLMMVRLLATGGCGYRLISGSRGKVVWARLAL
ncbi:ATP-binding protein [Actinomadura luteofluorescens]|uniref:Anti-sigma regulatory factor (Ser/Thr protein kinase) n=1 Tax=Actinomadura luteofluorescens TaxID=46163 RepID=A0A7Y9EH82_9ACTN|nr:ATP-binding protein [Actinomadura luteofluorescens]NYD47730.1 anti-sigma regulatory factor (Ser/Thr protein kinase) [Actinomadura luteofluorescens]